MHLPAPLCCCYMQASPLSVWAAPPCHVYCRTPWRSRQRCRCGYVNEPRRIVSCRAATTIGRQPAFVAPVTRNLFVYVCMRRSMAPRPSGSHDWLRVRWHSWRRSHSPRLRAPPTGSTWCPRRSGASLVCFLHPPTPPPPHLVPWLPHGRAPLRHTLPRCHRPL